MKITALFLLAAAAFAQGPHGPGGGGFGRGPGMFGGGPQAYVTGAPYSGTSTVQSQEVLMDGNRITNSHTVNVARDGSGRVRTEETVKPAASTGKPSYTLVTILDYVGGKRYLLDSSTMTAYESGLHTPRTTSTSATPPAPTSGTRPNGATVTVTTLPQTHVNGVLANGTQITETIPVGAIGNAQAITVTRVSWVSADLKVPVQIKSSDPRFGTTDMELTNIVQAEPSASLFVVPAGYTVKQGGGRGPGGPGAAAGFGGGAPQGGFGGRNRVPRGGGQ